MQHLEDDDSEAALAALRAVKLDDVVEYQRTMGQGLLHTAVMSFAEDPARVVWQQWDRVLSALAGP